MKKLLLSLLFAVPVSLFAQQGFRAEGDALVWERTYAGTNVATLVQTRPGLLVDAFMGNTCTGRGEEVKSTCGSGSALLRNNCKFDFTITLTDGSYVVRVSNLKIIEKFGPMQARTVANRCEKYFMSAEGVKKDTRTQADMECLDSFLGSLFGNGSLAGSEALTAN